MLLEKRHHRFGSHAADSAGRATLQDGNSFPLKERSLRKSDAADEETEQQGAERDLRETPST
jgi:hypothetical protein